MEPVSSEEKEKEKKEVYHAQKIILIATVKQKLEKCDDSKGIINKALVCQEIYDCLVAYKHIWYKQPRWGYSIASNNRFTNTVQDKLLTLRDISEYEILRKGINFDSYFPIMFGYQICQGRSKIKKGIEKGFRKCRNKIRHSQDTSKPLCKVHQKKYNKVYNRLQNVDILYKDIIISIINYVNV